MPRSVHPYTDDDLPAVLSAWENASRLAHPFLTDDFMAAERQAIADVYMPQSDTWVLQQDGGVIGFISLIGNEVGALFVQPDHHGTGAGRALMDKAKSLHETLEVQVFAANSIGRRFYDKARIHLDARISP